MANDAKRILAHAQWMADLRAGFIPRRRRVANRKRLEEPKGRWKPITLSNYAYHLAVYAKKQLETPDHKITFDQFINFLMNREKKRNG